ncbi:MAG TPA: thioesterase family protein [Anaeromyxobacter sp.]|nr:thioesterase family protein [Anaeromyxobacter sp.]
MKSSLAAGLTFAFRYTVPETKTVPHVFHESERFREMPPVFATAYMVGLIEWACIEAIQPHLDPGEQSVGTGIWVTHSAATPPGLTVTVDLSLAAVDGKRLTFAVRAHDGVDPIGEGRHERFVIDRERFVRKVDAKKAAALRG